ncbi:7917_t:CDS:2, partial [Dentiscutata heterogama]
NHCISYKLALAGNNAAKQVDKFKQYEKIVHNIYSYFSRSSEHMMHLQIIEENIDEVELSWGTYLCKYMNKQNIITEELPIIITKFAYTAIESLEKRFLNQIQVNAFYIFDPMSLPTKKSELQKYGKNEIEILIVEYIFSQQNLIKTKLQNSYQEWSKLDVELNN